MDRSRWFVVLVAVAVIMLWTGILSARNDDDDDEEEFTLEEIVTMGATPGGAQDISYFRDEVKEGGLPHPNTLTPEGLFSEHDLPLSQTKPCTQLLCISGQATSAHLLVQDDVRYLAQLGFESNLTPKTFSRDPLNLIAVVDTSGSMGGKPIETVRESLLQVASQLRKGDQMAIVRYSDRVEVVLHPTNASKLKEINNAIMSLVISGSTYMEAGLALGYQVAQESAGQFKGTTRVMLFTDERPNVGSTDAESFMDMAEKGSHKGIGLTTIGVATHFGAELATKISSVRGGNLFFFPDVADMKRVFTDEFDTLVTELAYDLHLVIRPEKGLRISGVYGIPGEVLKWEGKDIHLEVSTIFLSLRKGAIYVAFSPDNTRGLPVETVKEGRSVGTVDLTYVQAKSGEKENSRFSLVVASEESIGVGLKRGIMLVNEYTSLEEAAKAHYEANNQEKAYQAIRALATLFRYDDDPDLAKERTLVFTLEETLAKKSGHHGEPGNRK